MLTLFSFRRAAMALVAAMLFVAGAQAGERSPTLPPTVVELYTSQGCNSCPPADALLGRLTGRNDVLALTFNVDYWDYLGWKDTLASAENTYRQQNYARHMRSRTVYTPQMVIGGRSHAVGSDQRAVDAAIEASQADAGKRLEVTFSRKGDMILLHISAGDHPGDATIWLVRYDKRRDVEILRGENAGHHLSYYNVVRDYKSLGLWRGEKMEIAFDLDTLAQSGTDGCAVLVQLDRFGPIIGAARMTFDGSS